MPNLIDFIAFFSGVAGVLCLIGVAVLLLIDEHIAHRAREKHIASLKRANNEVTQRHRVPYPSPLPTLKGSK